MAHKNIYLSIRHIHFKISIKTICLRIFFLYQGQVSPGPPSAQQEVAVAIFSACACIGAMTPPKTKPKLSINVVTILIIIISTSIILLYIFYALFVEICQYFIKSLCKRQKNQIIKLIYCNNLGLLKFARYVIIYKLPKIFFYTKCNPIRKTFLNKVEKCFSLFYYH